MGQPTADDPLGQRPDAHDMLRESIRTIVQQELGFKLRGLSSNTCEGIPSEILAMELIARGWIAYKPTERTS